MEVQCKITANQRVEHKEENKPRAISDLWERCSSRMVPLGVDSIHATVQNKWLKSKKGLVKLLPFSTPNLVLHVEVRLHVLIVELDRCHRAIFVIVLLLVPELPAEGFRRAAQASTHYSEYLPREGNSCELAETCRPVSPTTAVPLVNGFLHVRTNWRNGILTATFEEHESMYTQELFVFSSGNPGVSTVQNQSERSQEDQQNLSPFSLYILR